MPDHIQWLAKGLEKPGVDANAVAKELGKHHSVVYKLLNGERKFHVDELPKIAKAIGEPVPTESAAKVFSFRKNVLLKSDGFVSVGAYAKLAPAEGEDMMIVFKDASFPKAHHMAVGVSVGLRGYENIMAGDRLFCLRYDALMTGFAFKEGTLILVERTRRGKSDLAIKSAVFSDNDAAKRPELAFNVMNVTGGSGNGTVKRTTDAFKIVAVVRSICRNCAA